MESKRAKILEAAIELFARWGYSAAVRDIAERAGSTTMTMSRLFRGKKEYLFEEALQEVIRRYFDPGKFVLGIYAGPKNPELKAALLFGIRQWYSNMSPLGARLLGYALLSESEKWRRTAVAAVENISGVLATTLDRQLSKDAKEKHDTRIVAKTLITTLVAVRMSHPFTHSVKADKLDKQEAAEVEALVKHWLRGLPASL